LRSDDLYARAAAWIAGVDRWTEAMWRDLENQVGLPKGVQPEAVPEVKEAVSGVIRRAPERRGRRQFHSSYMR
jgi:hypothetical protein